MNFNNQIIMDEDERRRPGERHSLMGPTPGAGLVRRQVSQYKQSYVIEGPSEGRIAHKLRVNQHVEQEAKNLNSAYQKKRQLLS